MREFCSDVWRFMCTYDAQSQVEQTRIEQRAIILKRYIDSVLFSSNIN